MIALRGGVGVVGSQAVIVVVAEVLGQQGAAAVGQVHDAVDRVVCDQSGAVGFAVLIQSAIGIEGARGAAPIAPGPLSDFAIGLVLQLVEQRHAAYGHRRYLAIARVAVLHDGVTRILH